MCDQENVSHENLIDLSWVFASADFGDFADVWLVKIDNFKSYSINTRTVSDFDNYFN